MFDKIQTGARTYIEHLRTILEHYQQEMTQNHLQISIDLNPQIMM